MPQVFLSPRADSDYIHQCALTTRRLPIDSKLVKYSPINTPLGNSSLIASRSGTRTEKTPTQGGLKWPSERMEVITPAQSWVSAPKLLHFAKLQSWQCSQNLSMSSTEPRNYLQSFPYQEEECNDTFLWILSIFNVLARLLCDCIASSLLHSWQASWHRSTSHWAIASWMLPFWGRYGKLDSWPNLRASWAPWVRAPACSHVSPEM